MQTDFPPEVRSVNAFQKIRVDREAVARHYNKRSMKFIHQFPKESRIESDCLITGGGNGIGRAVAHRMAAAGMTVVIADYDHAAAQQVRQEIIDSGGNADALSVDVAVAREVKAVVTDIAQRFGRIDVLANIAGGSFYTKRIEDFTWAEWKQVIDTNLKGIFM